MRFSLRLLDVQADALLRPRRQRHRQKVPAVTYRKRVAVYPGIGL